MDIDPTRVDKKYLPIGTPSALQYSGYVPTLHISTLVSTVGRVPRR